MTAPEPRYSREETAQRGQELYERAIRPLVEAAHQDEFAAIDIETGAYELDPDDYCATENLLARQPNAQIWLMRVGHAATYRIGGAAFLRKETRMIVGIVNASHEATLSLRLQSTDGAEHQIAVIVDTGFSGSLTLPPALIDTLGLPFRTRGSAFLADGSVTNFDIYAATIIWDGAPRNILVEAAETDPLIGMRLLYGFTINIQAVDGGSVTIESLPN